MGRKPSYTALDEQRIAEFVAQGMSAADIAGALAAEGRRIPLRTVSRIMSHAKPRSRPRPDAEAITPDVFRVEEDDSVERNFVDSISRAHDEERVDEFVKLSRALMQYRDNRRKNTPAMVPDPNDHPDMVAAAARGRAKLVDYVERARAGK
jgi:hypothetical protein